MHSPPPPLWWEPNVSTPAQVDDLDLDEPDAVQKQWWRRFSAWRVIIPALASIVFVLAGIALRVFNDVVRATRLLSFCTLCATTPLDCHRGVGFLCTDSRVQDCT